jgi:hypothetical protein
MRESFIMIAATVLYFAIAIPVAMWIGRWMSERNK